jgi:putative glutathione S-transferase
VANPPAVESLYTSLDRLEDLLSTQRYVVGDVLTEADIRLFMTLIRFDEVYVVYFKCNKRRIIDYPNILHYCRDIYQLNGVSDSIDMDHIKTHYFT